MMTIVIIYCMLELLTIVITDRYSAQSYRHLPMRGAVLPARLNL